MERRQAKRVGAVFEGPPPYAMPLAEIARRFASDPNKLSRAHGRGRSGDELEARGRRLWKLDKFDLLYNGKQTRQWIESDLRGDPPGSLKDQPTATIRLAVRLHQSLMTGEWFAWGRPSGGPHAAALTYAWREDKIVPILSGAFDSWPLSQIDFPNNRIFNHEVGQWIEDVHVCDKALHSRVSQLPRIVDPWSSSISLGTAIDLLDLRRRSVRSSGMATQVGPYFDAPDEGGDGERANAFAALEEYAEYGQLHILARPLGPRPSDYWYNWLSMCRFNEVWNEETHYLPAEEPITFEIRVYRRGECPFDRSGWQFALEFKKAKSPGRRSHGVFCRYAFRKLVSLGTINANSPRNEVGRFVRDLAQDLALDAWTKLTGKVLAPSTAADHVDDLFRQLREGRQFDPPSSCKLSVDSIDLARSVIVARHQKPS